MSEYQYYEFHAIDQSLDKKELAEISAMSSRVQLNSRKAIFTYSYSDFRYSEEEVLLDYFDYMFYQANWGTKRIMIKFPESLVNYEKLKKYKISIDYHDTIEIRVFKKSLYVILDIYVNEEDYSDWVDEDYAYDFLSMRQEILQDDYRAIFLIWLKHLEELYQNEELSSDFSFAKAIIPAKLNHLNATSISARDFFRISHDWINAIAEYSKNTEQIDYGNLVEKLSPDKQLYYLKKILNDEPNVKALLVKELKSSLNIKENEETLKIDALVDRVKHIESSRLKKEKKLQEESLLKEMQKIHTNANSIRTEIINRISVNGSSKSYEIAIAQLLDLKKMYNYFGKSLQFDDFMIEVNQISSRKSAMKRRLRDNNLIT